MLSVLGNNLIAKLSYEKSRSGIIIPQETTFSKYHSFVYAVVEAVGPDYPYKIKIGDKILIRRHEGKAFKYKDRKYLKLREGWVDAIFGDDKTITPLGNRLLIKREQVEDRGEIIFLSNKKKVLNQGEVVIAGSGKIEKKKDGIASLTPMTIQVGQKVLFGDCSGSEVSAGGYEFVIMSEDELLGILE